MAATNGRRFAIALGLLVLAVPEIARSDSLKLIFGPRFTAEHHQGRRFATPLRGGGNSEARLGVHALRRHQELQGRARGTASPYDQRYRLGGLGGGRPLWPNAEVTLRGGPTYQGDKSTCHRVDKITRTAEGRRVRVFGTRCYDGYGQPHVLPATQDLVDAP
ncbi:MAG: hypothetical protein QF893_14835 [Alphaproteobacteria bacterium]|nr:hypothetical protein [Alphaproteobacteria bacterium]